MKKKSDSFITIIANLIVIGVILMIFLGSSITPLFSQQDVTVKVIDKSQTSGNGWTYLISSEQEVFQNRDNWVFGKFNSSDYQVRIKEGKTYKFHVAGWRVPMFSWYRNIINYEEVK